MTDKTPAPAPKGTPEFNYEQTDKGHLPLGVDSPEDVGATPEEREQHQRDRLADSGGQSDSVSTGRG
jgi:hypothetical protein